MRLPLHCLPLRTFALAVLLLAAVSLSAAHGAIVSINFQGTAGTNGLVGSNIAGFVPAENWNDVTGNVQSNFALMDNFGASSGVTVSYSLNIGGGTSTSFPNVGDNRLLAGNIWMGSFNPADIVIGGTIPYAMYDLYVYYNGNVAAGQSHQYSILGTGLSKLAVDVAGLNEGEFIESDGVNHGNFIRFSGLTNATLPNFTLRAQGVGAQHGYFNGLQIVEVVPPPVAPIPEPATIVLALALGGMALVSRRPRRSR